MAKKNRAEAIVQVGVKIVPSVSNSIHKDLLNNDILNGVVFEKDVISTQTPSGGNVIVDYSNKDTATVVTASNLSVSFTNIENGAVKFLSITKAAANNVSFAGAIDVSLRKAYIDSKVSLVQYEVRNKNGLITVNSINIDNDVSNLIETDVLAVGSWNMDANSYKNVAYTIPSGKAITGFACAIRSNSGNNVWDINSMNLNASNGTVNGCVFGVGTFISTGITLYRTSGGNFDGSSFNGSFTGNRGYITIFLKTL